MLFAPDADFWRAQAPPVFRVRVETTRGPFTMELTRALAPIGVDHFYNLVRAGYYDDSRFSRTIAGWITQFGIAGDPAVTAIWAGRPIRRSSAWKRRWRRCGTGIAPGSRTPRIRGPASPGPPSRLRSSLPSPFGNSRRALQASPAGR